MSVRRVTVAALLCAALCVGCGDYPEPLSSARDIKRASPDIEMIAIADLPLTDYALLTKFQKLKTADFYKQGSVGATDAKLRALADVGFSTLKGVVLLYCPLVTDQGIKELARIRSLEWLQLEGTSITDLSLEVLASRMNLTGVNVAQTKVTLKGLETLAGASSLRELGFSCEGETTAEVCEVINKCKQVRYFCILDTSGQLDTNVIAQCARDAGAEFLVHSKGALQ